MRYVCLCFAVLALSACDPTPPPMVLTPLGDGGDPVDSGTIIARDSGGGTQLDGSPDAFASDGSSFDGSSFDGSGEDGGSEDTGIGCAATECGAGFACCLFDGRCYDVSCFDCCSSTPDGGPEPDR